MSQSLLPEDFAWGDSFPQLSRRLRLGIVGGGRIAITQAMAARMSGYWDIVAGALSTQNQRSLIRAQQFHIAEDRAYHCYQQMAESEAQRPDGIDAVMITTPNHLHYDVAQNFLRATFGDLRLRLRPDKPTCANVSVRSTQAVRGYRNALRPIQRRCPWHFNCHPLCLGQSCRIASAAIWRSRWLRMGFRKTRATQIQPPRRA